MSQSTITTPRGAGSAEHPDRSSRSIATVLVAAYVATIPWEVTKLALPILRLDSVGEQPVSVIDLSRIILMPLLLFAPSCVRRLRRERTGLLFLASALLVATSLASAISPDKGYALRELVRLGAGLGVMMVAAGLDGLEAVRTVCRWFRWSMTAAAALIVVEAVTRQVVWNEGLAAIRRFNGPFADPNVAARFLLIALIFLLCDRPLRIGPASRQRQASMAKAIQGVILVVAIAATGSRGVLVAAAIAMAASLALPDRNARRSTVWLLAGTTLVAGLLLVASPTFRARLASFQTGVDAVGARTSLVRAGWEMFLDRPLVGHGLGGFSDNILGDYAEFQSYYGERGSKSHTAVVTILAEGGMLGLVVLSALIIVVVRLVTVSLRAPDAAQRLLALGLGLAYLVIFVASQAEGRLLDEPLLWPLVGLLAVCARPTPERSAAKTGPSRAP